MPAGFMIPVVILFIISFPPLFGHEIIAILVGLVWGFGLGFIIVSVGTVLGEIGNFYAFRYLLGAKGHRAERTNLRYACLARIVREGGFVIAVVTRLSAVPGHLTTAVFSTCGMNFLVFTAAAALSMPKQMVTVYLGGASSPHTIRTRTG
ncbi:snare associated Golgi protein [Calocera viscosa TUFC12733]|uniref:Golgi apparatus membrane protein TVP38 n=1 Tax=Calocera viscosa (strain TUFC12733) TaxID=1330018 RepID=A0A167LX94_CALVF|nr:snare associated Golgi protein [Calocera viscosa TUFC12733]